MQVQDKRNGSHGTDDRRSGEQRTLPVRAQVSLTFAVTYIRCGHEGRVLGQHGS